MLALRWGNVDLNVRLLRVVETVYDGHFDKPKTKRGMRTIPIGAGTVEILTVLRPAAVDARTLVFAKSDGMPLDRWNLLRKHLKPAAKKSGLPGVTWHLLRHSHATMLDIVGTPIGTMQSLLGHSAPEITREIYLHAIPEEERRAVESVERLLFGPKLDPSSWGEPLRWHKLFGHSFRVHKSVLASPSRRRGLGKGTAFESPSPAVL